MSAVYAAMAASALSSDKKKGGKVFTAGDIALGNTSINYKSSGSDDSIMYAALQNAAANRAAREKTKQYKLLAFAVCASAGAILYIAIKNKKRRRK